MKRVPVFLLVFILCITICLSGCKTNHASSEPANDKNGDIGHAEQVSDSDAGSTIVSPVLFYQVRQLENPDHYYMHEVPDTVSFCANGCFYFATGNYAYSGIAGTTLLQYDADGALVAAIGTPDAAVGAKQIYPLSDGSFVILRQTGINGSAGCSLLIADADSNILAQYTLPEFAGGFDPFGLSDTACVGMHVNEREDGSVRICVNAFSDAYYFDEQLNLLQHIALDNEYDGVFMESEDVYLFGSSLPRMCRINMADGTLTRLDDLPVPPFMKYFCEIRFGADGNMYCIYDGSIYRCDGNRNLTLILDWDTGAYDGTGHYWICSDSSVYYQSETAVSEEYTNLVMLDIRFDETIAERQPITLANLSYQNNAWLRSVISLFNAENKDYYIDMTDYSVSRGNQNGASGSRQSIKGKFDSDLLKNGTPDLILFSNTFESRDYINKNLLLDLSSYDGGRLLGCAVSAYTESDGRQLLLPLSMTADTCASASAVLDRNLTWDLLYAFEAELKADTTGYAALCSSDGIRYGWQYMLLPDFYDYAAKTASFDSEDFIRREQFLYDMQKSYIISDYGRLSRSDFSTGGTYGIVGGTKILDGIRSGDVRLLDVPFDTVEAYAVLKLIFGDTPFTLCGYPTEDGRSPGVRVQSDNLLGIFADTEYADGCRAFIDFVLSDAIQSAPYLTVNALPVTRTAMEKALDDWRYLYYPETFSVTEGASSVGGKTAGKSLLLGAAAHAAYPDKSLLADYRELELTDADRKTVLAFFDACISRANPDETIDEIVQEELSAYESGAKTLRDAAQLIQSRVQIYLNE